MKFYKEHTDYFLFKLGMYNPGQFNKRIEFLRITTIQNQYGGTTPTITPILTTFGALTPYREYNQQVNTGGDTALESNRVLTIRFRNSFTPKNDMLFRDVSDPNEINPAIYTIKSILPYYPGTKVTFENNSQIAYQNKRYVYMIGVKQDNSYLNIVS